MAAGNHPLAITPRLGAAAAASAPSLAEMGELLEQTRRSVGASATYRELQGALDALPAHVHGAHGVGGAVRRPRARRRCGQLHARRLARDARRRGFLGR